MKSVWALLAALLFLSLSHHTAAASNRFDQLEIRFTGPATPKTESARHKAEEIQKQIRRKYTQGHIVDQIAVFLKSEGFENFMIHLEPAYQTQGLNGKDAWQLHSKDALGKEVCLVSLRSAGAAVLTSSHSSDSKASSDWESVIVVDQSAANAQTLALAALSSDQDKAQKIFSHLTAQNSGAILRDRNGKITTIGDVTAACFE